MATAHGLSGRRPLRVLFILDAFADPHAGTEGQFWMLLNALDRKRVAPGILLLRPSPFLEQHAAGMPLEVLNVRRLRSPLSLWKLWLAVRRAKRRGFEVAQIFLNDSALVFPPLLKLAGIRTVVARRDLGFWYTRGNLPLLRFNARLADACVANCEAVKEAVCQGEGFAAEKVAVIYNGYDETRAATQPPRDIRAELGIGASERLVGIVANLRRIKRLDDLIRAFAQLDPERRDARLVVIGAGDLLDELRALAASLGIAGRVTFTGQLREVLPLVRELDVAVLCSQSEGLSNALIEYMNCGKPTVCTNVGGNPELVQDGRNGFTVPVGDVAALAERIGRLLSDSGLARSLGQQARADVKDKCSVGTMVAAHISLYERLAGYGTP